MQVRCHSGILIMNVFAHKCKIILCFPQSETFMHIAIGSFVIVVQVIKDFLEWYNYDAASFTVGYQKTNIMIEKPYQTSMVQYCGKSDLVSKNILPYSLLIWNSPQVTTIWKLIFGREHFVSLSGRVRCIYMCLYRYS